MELRHLRYFVCVADELHFGRAARRLGISQPPLSQQIRALEEELGLELFDRTSRRVELTDAGRIFLTEAQLTLEQATHAMSVARRVQSGEAGELSIGFAPSVPFVPVFASALVQFRQSYPAVLLTLAELNRDEQIAGVVDRRIDLGFIRGFEQPQLPKSLSTNQVIEESLVVVLHDQNPLALQNRPLRITDIADLPIVLYHQAMGAGFNDHLALLFKREGRPFRVAQDVTGLASLLGLVAAGVGVSVLAQSLAALRADHLVYRPLDEPDAITRLWLVRRHKLSVTGQRFVDFLA
jgi:DNA-binding transcriptional LysR family regulator